MITVTAPYHTSKWYHLDTKTFCTEKQMSDIQFSKDNWVFGNSGSIKADGYRQWSLLGLWTLKTTKYTCFQFCIVIDLWS